MPPIVADSRAHAQEHVRMARSIVDRQRALVERLNERGHDSRVAERLLATFEASLAAVENESDAFVGTPR